MKKIISRILKAGCGCGLVCAAVSVCGQDTGFYFKGDVGGNVTPDVDVKEFFGANLPDAKLELKPGYRIGLGGGYQFTDWVAAEAEVGFMGNEIDSMTGATRIHDAFIGNVPVLVNAKLRYPMKRCPVTPYIGAGVGFSETFIDVDELDAGGVNVTGNDADTVFAWQAFAGLRYKLSERMGLGLEYRFLQTESPSWEAEIFGSSGQSANEVMKLGRIQTHVVSLVFDFRF
ncbi:MAG TPA: porin family protein [Verrucomicrobiae bacterium]